MIVQLYDGASVREKYLKINHKKLSGDVKMSEDREAKIRQEIEMLKRIEGDLELRIERIEQKIGIDEEGS